MPLPYTPLPIAPDRKRPAVFADEGDAFLGALPTFGSEMAAIGAQAETNAATAAADAATATAAANSATASAVSAINAPGTNATSTTSLTVGTGSKSLTVQTGKSFVVGQFVVIASTASPANYMIGQITAYTSGTGALVVNAVTVGGSGTLAAWTISLCAPGFVGGTLTTALDEAPPVTLASAATVDIGSAASNTINITGTTTITALGTDTAGAFRRLVFAASLLLTHNNTSLILPGATSLQVSAGDVVEFVSLGSGNWKCLAYSPNVSPGLTSMLQFSQGII